MREAFRKHSDALGRQIGLSGEGLRAAAAHGLHMWLTIAGVAVLGFVTPLAFVHLATQEDYGRFSLIAAIIAISNIVTLPGLNISLKQAAARGFHGAMPETASIRVRFALIGVAGLLVIGGFMRAAGDARTGNLLMLLAPVLPLIYGMDVAQSFLNGIQRFGALSALMMLAALVPSATVVLMLLAGYGAGSAVLGYYGALAAANVASFVVVSSRYRQNRRTDPASIQYGKRLTLITSLGTLQFYLDRVIVAGLLSLETLAIYSAGKLFQQAVAMTWGALNQLYAPKLASRPIEDARHLTRATLLYVWALFGVLALLIVIATPAIVRIAFGDAYASAVPVARLLTIAALVAIPGAQFEVLFTATGDERRLYTHRVTFAATQLLFVGVGASLFGLSGAVWGTTLTYALNSVTGFLLDRHRR
jgi:O-antigen/teichoic acid export membrane protein